MGMAVVRIIHGTHRGIAFPETAARDQRFRSLWGQDLEIVLFEPPADPMKLYDQLTEAIGKMAERGLTLQVYELGVADIMLLNWLAILRQSKALQTTILSPAYRTGERELTLEETFDRSLMRSVSFSGYFEVGQVAPVVKEFYPLN